MNIPTGQGTTTVLVTGGAGYLAGWIIKELLSKGFRVHTTVRDISRQEMVRQALDEPERQDRLTFFAADLLQDDGWDAAVRGCKYVIHTASPMDPGSGDIVTPARSGTLRVLEAAEREGVERLVLTSSAVAALPPLGSQGVIEESRWTDRPDEPVYQYPRAKTLAERDAWSFVKQSAHSLDLTAILPGLLLGPALGGRYSASVGIIARMLQGGMPAVPRIGFAIAAARDVAALHVLAMASPDAAGERFLASGDFLWMKDMATTLTEALGESAAKVSTKEIPDAYVMEMAKTNAQMAVTASNLGVRQTVDTSKVLRVLGWRTRPAVTSVIDAGKSLIQTALVQ